MGGPVVPTKEKVYASHLAVMTLLLRRSHGSEWRALSCGTTPAILAMEDAVDDEPEPIFEQSVASSIVTCSEGGSALMRRAWFGCRYEQLVRRLLLVGVGDNSSACEHWLGFGDGLAWKNIKVMKGKLGKLYKEQRDSGQVRFLRRRCARFSTSLNTRMYYRKEGEIL
jgi:hypothetical protein